MNVVIIKYNAGNIFSVDYALRRLGVNAEITGDIEKIQKADKVIFLSDIDGVLDKEGKLISKLDEKLINKFKKDGTISGGMIPKIECCMLARNGGVPRTHIIDGRVPHSLLIEMFSDRGIGTMIY